MRGLYAIVDTDTLSRRGIPILPFTEAVLDAGPAAIQLRNKHGGARETLELLRSIAPIAARAGVPLFANDRPDLALLARCDGVHLGQEDVPAALVRSILPTGASLRVGLSTHNALQVDRALREVLDYVAIGPIFATASKQQPDPVVGLVALSSLALRVRRERPELPIVAIGGISLETAGAVGEIADCAAIIGALVPEGGGSGAALLDRARERARALHTAIVGDEGWT